MEGSGPSDPSSNLGGAMALRFPFRLPVYVLGHPAPYDVRTTRPGDHS